MMINDINIVNDITLLHTLKLHENTIYKLKKKAIKAVKPSL